MTEPGRHEDVRDLFKYIDAHAEDYIATLQRLCRQPSVAAQGVSMVETAAMVEGLLTGLGAKPRLVDTRGGYPIVYGELGGKVDKTLGFYNHYDVQPAEPLDEWESDPWAAEIRDGRIWARGVADNKGNLAARVAAVDAWQKVNGELPLNLKFIVEGEEEIGSPHIHNFAEDHPDLCQADAYIWEFGGKDIAGRPQIHLGLKGICYVELRAKGARMDWHSSVATSVPNPGWRLVWALATLKDQREHVLIPGFYDKVVSPGDADLEAVAKLPDTEAQDLANLGIDRFLQGLTGLELKKRNLFQPTCTISGFESGYTGKGAKTVLPGKAMAKLDMRLVPNQDPFEIYDLLRKHLDATGFDDIETELLSPGFPARTPLDAPIAQVVIDSYRQLSVKEPVVVPTSPGSGPWYQLCGQFGIDACTAGVGHAKSQAHAPNENIYVDDFITGIKQICLIMDGFSRA